jgi:hypothetical protein
VCVVIFTLWEELVGRVDEIHVSQPSGKLAGSGHFVSDTYCYDCLECDQDDGLGKQ